MSALAEHSQSLEALDRANAIRVEGAKTRRLLTGTSASAVRDAIVDPNPGLAALTLRRLFCLPSCRGPVPRFGERGLNRALTTLAAQGRSGRRAWHPELRLRDLTRPERVRLIQAIALHAPKRWREELAPSPTTKGS